MIRANRSSSTAYWYRKLSALTAIGNGLEQPVPPSQTVEQVTVIDADTADLLRRVAGSDQRNSLLVIAASLGALLDRIGQPAAAIAVHCSLQASDAERGHAVYLFVGGAQSQNLRDRSQGLAAAWPEAVANSDYDLIELRRRLEANGHPPLDLLAPVELAEARVTLPGRSSLLLVAEGMPLIKIGLSGALASTDRLATISTHLPRLLRASLDQPALPLAQLPVMSPTEIKARGGYCLAGSKIATTSLDLAFASIVDKYRNERAVLAPDGEWSYGELDRASNQFAHHLIEEVGIQPGDLVALKLEKSRWMIGAIWGVLKSGAAYLPLDVEAPLHRNRMIIESSGAKAVVAKAEDVLEFGDIEVNFTAVDLVEGSDDLVAVQRSELSTAYVIYTSGSTGEPQGVAVPDGAVVRLALSDEGLPVKPGDRVLQPLNYSFDASVVEIFSALLNGATTCLLEKDRLLDFAAVGRFLTENTINVGQFTTALFNKLADVAPEHVACFDWFGFGGERASPAHIAKVLPYLRSNAALINIYGPTEATVMATIHQIEPADTACGAIPIGRPLSGTTVRVLDAGGIDVPDGVDGELHIGGDRLAIGYHNNEALTRERFINVIGPDGRPERLYRTGDIVRFRPDGALVFVGRRDGQTKINGHRVEIGEVESALSRVQGVRACHVVVARAGDDASLVAYVEADNSIDDQWLRREMRELLPIAMVPSVFVQIDQLPLTNNGKVDVGALPDWQTIRTPDREMPSTAIEVGLAKIWQNALGNTNVGRLDNFFTLGGDSLKAIPIISQICEEYGVDLTVRDLFEQPTIADLARVLEAGGGQVARPILADWREDPLEYAELDHPDVETYFPVPGTSLGMVFHSEFDSTDVYHVQEDPIWIDDPTFDCDLFERVIRQVTERHEILRAGIDIIGFPQPLIIVRREADINLTFHDLSTLSQTARIAAVNSYLAADRKQGFSLAESPLWRIALFDWGDGRRCICFSTHHAVWDGWSNALFWREIHDRYQAARLGQEIVFAPLACSYADFAEDQRRSAANPTTAAYWREQLSHARPYQPAEGFGSRLHIPERARGEVSEALRQRLQHRVAEGNWNAKTIYFTAVVAALRACSANDDFTIGVVENARPLRRDGDRLLGCFVNTAPFRAKLEWSDIKSVLDQVQVQFAELKEHGRLPLGVVARMAGRTSSGLSPFSEVLFNYVDFHVSDGLPRTEGPEVDFGLSGETESLLDVTIDSTGEGVRLTYLSRDQAFTGPSLESLMQRTLDALNAIACGELPDQPSQTPMEPAKSPVTNATPGHLAPRQLQEKVACLFRDILQCEDIALEANFFEMGGDSIALLALRARISSAFNLSIDLGRLVDNPSISGVAEQVAAANLSNIDHDEIIFHDSDSRNDTLKKHKYSDYKSSHLIVNGISLHHVDWGGSGEILLFLPGMGHTAHIFDEFAPLFSDRYRVLGLTRRGHGRSGQPDSGYDADSLSRDLRGFMDAMEVERVHLIGHSMAGNEMTRLAARHPDRVASLVYLDAAYDRSRILELSDFEGRYAVADAPALSSWDALIEWHEAYFGFWSNALETDLRDRYVAESIGLRPVIGVATGTKLLEGLIDYRPEFTRVTVPALLLYAQPENVEGKSDYNYVKWYRDQVATMPSMFLDAQTIELPNTHHYLFLDRPADVRAAMDIFLARCAARPEVDAMKAR